MIDLQTALSWCDGNPGAASFLAAVSKSPHGFMILGTLKICPKIRGQYLWILYKDLGRHNLERISKICECVPLDVLEQCCTDERWQNKDEIINKYLKPI